MLLYNSMTKISLLVFLHIWWFKGLLVTHSQCLLLFTSQQASLHFMVITIPHVSSSLKARKGVDHIQPLGKYSGSALSFYPPYPPGANKVSHEPDNEQEQCNAQHMPSGNECNQH